MFILLCGWLVGVGGGGGILMYFVLFLAPWYTKCNQIYILQVQQTRFLLHDYAPRELG